MSTAAMNSVEQTKAGVASGILSMSRMVGGSFGVAAMGALVTGLGSHRLGELLPGLSSSARSQLAESLGAGAATNVSGHTASALQDAFVYALNDGLRVGGDRGVRRRDRRLRDDRPQARGRPAHAETGPLPATAPSRRRARIAAWHSRGRGR